MTHIRELLATHAGYEQIRVVAGIADQGQHAARTRVQSHHRAAPVTQRRGCRNLQPAVQVQGDILTGNGGLDVQHLAYAAVSVSFDLLVAYLAV